MADNPQEGSSGGRIRARGFVGGSSSRGGYNGGSSRGAWPGSDNGGGYRGDHRQKPYDRPEHSPPSVAPTEEVSALESEIKQEKMQGRGERGGRGGSRGGRGGLRGNRYLPEIVHTRTDTSVAKQGNTGRPIMLQTNYFRVLRNEDERIFHYRVDFNPSVEANKKMRALMFQIKPHIGGYVFDGTQVFTRTKLEKDPAEFTARDKFTEEDHVITLRRVGDVTGTNEKAFVVFNLINRHAMAGLKLQLIGRSFFDPEAKVSIRQYGIDLYPGYLTSIRQHEQDVLMCAELTHRVMRTDTCYSLFEHCMNQRGNFKDNYKRMVLGTVVMSTYGKNNTYTISDVEFDVNPESTFETKKGPITFMQYFKDKYNIVIRDPRQPMLVSRSKARDIRAGLPELIYLIPELSRITGITDDMRRDFQ